MDIPQNPVDTAFSPAIRTVQQRKGSGEACDRLAMGRDITEGLAQFIATRTSFYLASASADGQPYIQHRGGPAGFLRVLDATTLAFADFRGNRQYISTGNFSENPKAFIFLMDYPNRRRIKIWGRMRVVEDDPYLLEGLLTDGYRAMPEQAMVLEVAAWDMNCPQHIPPFIPRQDVALPWPNAMRGSLPWRPNWRPRADSPRLLLSPIGTIHSLFWAFFRKVDQIIPKRHQERT